MLGFSNIFNIFINLNDSVHFIFFTVFFIIICQTALYIVKHAYQFYTFLVVLTGHFLSRVMGQIQMQDCRFGFSVRLQVQGQDRFQALMDQTWRFKFRHKGSNSNLEVQIQTRRIKFRLEGVQIQTRRFKFRLGSIFRQIFKLTKCYAF